MDSSDEIHSGNRVKIDGVARRIVGDQGGIVALKNLIHVVNADKRINAQEGHNSGIPLINPNAVSSCVPGYAVGDHTSRSADVCRGHGVCSQIKNPSEQADSYGDAAHDGVDARRVSDLIAVVIDCAAVKKLGCHFGVWVDLKDVTRANYRVQRISARGVHNSIRDGWQRDGRAECEGHWIVGPRRTVVERDEIFTHRGAPSDATAQGSHDDFCSARSRQRDNRIQGGDVAGNRQNFLPIRRVSDAAIDQNGITGVVLNENARRTYIERQVLGAFNAHGSTPVLACTVKAKLPGTIGVPVIRPLVSSNCKPSGSAPDTTVHSIFCAAQPVADRNWL